MHNLPPIYYIIFTAITAAAVLLQALVMLGLFLVFKKAIGKLIATSDEMKEHALPLVASTRSLVEDISPKLKTTTSNLMEVSQTLRQQAGHVNETLDVLLEKTNSQIRRVDEMVTGTFNTVDHATKTLESAVATPLRFMSGMVRGVKAGIEVLLAKKKPVSQEAVETVDSEEKKPA